jgi:uncharacterized protein (DUF302 family)
MGFRLTRTSASGAPIRSKSKLKALRESRRSAYRGRENAVTSEMDRGIVSRASSHSVDETVEKLTEILRGKGVKLFALVDHSGEAKSAGLQMRPTKLLIFGNPKAGTPLMISAPSIAIDLPLKMLIWEDGDGQAWATYNSPAYLAARHHLPAELQPTLQVVEALAAAATG